MVGWEFEQYTRITGLLLGRKTFCVLFVCVSIAPRENTGNDDGCTTTLVSSQASNGMLRCALLGAARKERA